MNKGIFGTEFDRPLSQIVNDIRNQMVRVRGQVSDVVRHGGMGGRVKDIEGLLTCGISYLYHSIEEMERHEIEWDDEKFGPSLRFNSRGIGSDTCPGCFVCGGNERLLSNIAAFVSSKEHGEKIVKWFKQGAWLDYRDWEPNYLQVKVGACEKHLPNLQKLDKTVSSYGVIREIDIENSKSLAALEL